MNEKASKDHGNHNDTPKVDPQPEHGNDNNDHAHQKPIKDYGNGKSHCVLMPVIVYEGRI